MYFWNYKKLALALHQGLITERNYSFYRISFAVAILIELAVPVLGSHVSLGSAILSNVIKFAVLWLIISIINKKGDNKDRLKRFICLLLPSYIQSFVLALFIGGVIGVIAGAAKISFGNAPSLEQWQKFGGIISGLSSIVYLGYCYIIGFKIASGRKSYSPTKEQ